MNIAFKWGRRAFGLVVLIGAMPFAVVVIAILNIFIVLMDSKSWQEFKWEYRESIEPINPFSKSFWEATKEFLK